MAIVPVQPNIVRYVPPFWPIPYSIPSYPFVYPPIYQAPLYISPYQPYSPALLPSYSYDYLTGAYLPTSYIRSSNPGNFWIWPV